LLPFRSVLGRGHFRACPVSTRTGKFKPASFSVPVPRHITITLASPDGASEHYRARGDWGVTVL
jgi:hypothetical protein